MNMNMGMDMWKMKKRRFKKLFIYLDSWRSYFARFSFEGGLLYFEVSSPSD